MFKRMFNRRAKVSLEQQLEVLAQHGIVLDEGVTVDDLLLFACREE